MATNPYLEASRIIENLAKKTDQVLVGFSGGKESRVILDLCCKGGFSSVIPYHFYFLPHLKCVEQRLAIAKERYNLEVVMYPSRSLLTPLKAGIYRRFDPALARLPVATRQQMLDFVQFDLSCPWSVLGMRRKDSLSRRRMFARIAPKQKRIVYPLQNWTKWDVFAYLKSHNIEIPSTDGGATSDIGLTNSSVLWMHDVYPDDYQIIKGIFPFVEAIVRRRQFYGVGEYYNENGPIKKFQKVVGYGEEKIEAPTC